MERIDKLNTLRERDGSLPSYAWPGGYPLYYVDREDNILCPDCANRVGVDEAAVRYADINYEDDMLPCDGCAHLIESAY